MSVDNIEQAAARLLADVEHHLAAVAADDPITDTAARGAIEAAAYLAGLLSDPRHHTALASRSALRQALTVAHTTTRASGRFQAAEVPGICDPLWAAAELARLTAAGDLIEAAPGIYTLRRVRTTIRKDPR